jgi:hypothetical protein
MDKDLEEIINLVNDLWCKTYEGSPVSDLPAIKARIVGIFDDRNCWHDASKAMQKEYTKLDKKIRKYEKSSSTN